MKEFIISNYASILAVIVFIIAVVVLAILGKKKVVYKILYTFVTEAEKTYGSGAGAEKLAEVMRRFYDWLPAVVRVFVTYGTMKKWIEQALTAAKKRWADDAGE